MLHTQGKWCYFDDVDRGEAVYEVHKQRVQPEANILV